MKQLIKRAIGFMGRCIPISTNLSADEARSNLQTFSPKPTGHCWTDNEVDLQYDLQIIVPCYNVEKWVEQCLESVLKQKTKYKILVSIVNDGSTDGTEKVIRDVMAKYWPSACTTLTHETSIYKASTRDISTFESAVGCPAPAWGGYTLELQNQENRGHSGARNAALRLIQGTYVTFLDSDDVLADGAIDKMLDAAFQYNAEILQCSWYEFAGNNTVTVGYTANIADASSEANSTNSVETKIGEHIVSEEGVLNDNRGVFSGFPWGKLYKYNVMEHFQFPEGFWFEDTPVSFMIAALPYQCATTKDVVYGYRLNPEGITQTSGRMKRSVESYWITEACLEEFSVFGLPYDQRAYEYLLRQSVMNEGRVRHQPMAIRKAIFVLTAELMGKYFPAFQTKDENMKWIEAALRNRQFVRFDLGTIGR